MTRALAAPLLAATMTAALPAGAAAAERAKADVVCQPAAKPLQYDCTIRLTDTRTGAPLTKVKVTVGADMPSMPMAHNVRPATAVPLEEPGAYRVRIELEMHGDWALQINLTGAIRDRVIKRVRFEDGRVVPSPSAPSRHKH
jgi:hypothetical protein